jgi:predicted nuclease of predicted toxin-antitoxin system
MRLILDECVDLRLLALLIAAGYDVVAMAHFGRFVMKDTDVLAAATADGRVVVSTDRDFARSVFWRRPHHAGFIQVGLTNLDPSYQAAEIDRILKAHENLDGAVMMVLDQGVRISQGRPPAAATRRAQPEPARKKYVRRRR